MKKARQPSAGEISAIIKSEWDLDLNDQYVSFEIVLRDSDPEGYDRRREGFLAKLSDHPDASEIKKRSYFGESFSLHFQASFPMSDVSGLDIDYIFHYPICTRAEIERIAKPKSAADYLLIHRADAIADNPRLKRIFLNRRERSASGWSLTSHFDSSQFDAYLMTLPADLQGRAREVPAGFAFIREPNGACVYTPKGSFIAISEVLPVYLYYMNAYLLLVSGRDHENTVATLLIALRIFLRTEAPDFDLDPRGKLPKRLSAKIDKIVEDQMQFIIGHEYAHYLLGHSTGTNPKAAPHTMMPAMHDGTPAMLYKPRKLQEFEADEGSLFLSEGDDDTIARKFNAAVWFFLGLDILYTVCAYINPGSIRLNTHPDPIDRIRALQDKVTAARTISPDLIHTRDDVEASITGFESVKASLLTDFIPFHIEELELYGSAYLPSMRDKRLSDRIDF